MSYLFPTYARWEIEPESAEGSYLYGKNGKTYLDFTSGIAVCNLGHRPKQVEAKVAEQLTKFWHVSNLFPIEIQEKAAEQLAKAAELDLVFFANSGAEANEAAIKLARKATGKTKFITFKQSFHGRTLATMAATGQDKIKQGFGPMLNSFIYVPFNDVVALENEMGDDVAAIMLEIVQGEGGIHVATDAFLQKVTELCEQYGSLLIVDEIQTGIGRTGKPFAYQHFAIKPDIITVAKGLGNGLPIGAMLGKKKFETVFGPGSHGSTFGGNPLSISAAIATMDIIFKDEFLTEVTKKGEYFIQALQQSLSNLSEVKDIRGLGLMIGIELECAVQPIIQKLRDEQLLVLLAGEKVIRLLPPLTATKEEMDIAIEKMKHVLSQL